jgi:hypothetical protein
VLYIIITVPSGTVIGRNVEATIGATPRDGPEPVLYSGACLKKREARSN